MSITTAPSATHSAFVLELSDVALIHLIARNNLEAFAELYDRYCKQSYALAVSLMNNYAEAEDVLQETFIGVWYAAKGFDEGKGKPFSWIMCLTRNKAIDHLRRRQRQRLLFVDTSEVDLAEAPEINTHSPHVEFQEVKYLVDRLSEKERQAIKLAYFKGLTFEEIATELEQPLGTIKARIRRGMARLRAHLNEVRIQGLRFIE